MSLENKLRECEFFVSKMREHEARAFGHREPFDFYLSAFLSAAQTAGHRLHLENRSIYPLWSAGWYATLGPAECHLIKFFAGDRNVEIHESRSNRAEKTESLTVGNAYADSSDTLLVSTLPDMTDVALQRSGYFFTINGRERRAIDVCGDYLALLRRMVTDFRTNKP
jgi:hypothetical protein